MQSAITEFDMIQYANDLIWYNGQWDDGISVVRDQVKIDTLVKKLRNIFNRYNMDLEIKHSLVSADYLDITMNLSTGECEPYQKPDN